jgi:hypothetical protein
MSRRRHLADAVALAGGVLLVVSAWLPWVRRGPGRSLHGHALADAVVALANNDVPGVSAGRLAVGWYLVPILGALTWIVVGVAHSWPRVQVGYAVATFVVVGLIVVAFGRVVGFGDLGLGALVAAAGALLVPAGLLVGWRAAAGAASPPRQSTLSRS